MLDRARARRVINSLKDGVPAAGDISEYSPVSNSLFDSRIRRDLEEIEDGLFSKVLFLNGSYGEGKSHFLELVRHKGLNEGFVVSMFSISTRGISFDMIERVVAELVRTLSVKGKVSGDTRVSVLDYIIRSWVGRYPDFENILPAMGLEDRDGQAGLLGLCRRVTNASLYSSEIEILNRWFLGHSHPRGDLIKQFGIYNHLTARNALPLLTCLAKFFKEAGYSGWIVLIDEQEIISTLLAPRRRELTDENIRLLIDQQSQLPGMYFLFATTDEFFTDAVGGVASYPALKTRITESNTVLLPPLTENEVREIAHKIRDIYEIAFLGGSRLEISDSQLNRCCELAHRRLMPVSARARTFVKSLIRILEAVKEDPKIDLQSRFDDIVEQTYDQVATEKEEALRTR